MLPYMLLLVLSLVVLLAVSAYVYQRRRQIDEMHGMMVGMTQGMLAGLVTATLYVIPTGDFLTGVILGSVVGLIFGVPAGKLGGHLGLVEGIVAGPMGGMMGAMLGQMIRPFNISVFIPFFMFIFSISMVGISYAVHCGVSCCGVPQKKPDPVTPLFIGSWAFAAVVLAAFSALLPFTIPGQSAAGGIVATLQATSVPKEDRKEAVMKGDFQEIDMVIAHSAYSPNVIVAKKGIPLKINVHADASAGCAREIVFPDLMIRKIVPENQTVVIDSPVAQAGTFKFQCSMDMAKGKIIVE